MASTHLIHRHKLLRGILLRLVQRRKFDVLGILRFIPEGRGHSVHVVGSDGHKLAFSTDVLMKLLLEIDKRLV